MENFFTKKLGIDFLQEEWYYKINYLGAAYIISDEFFEKHYIFESHGDKYDIFINSEGYMHFKKFDEVSNGKLEVFIINKKPKVTRLSYEDFSKSNKKIAENLFQKKNSCIEDIDDALSEENMIGFDKIVLTYVESSIVNQSYYGVTTLINDLSTIKVEKDEFMQYILNY